MSKFQKHNLSRLGLALPGCLALCSISCAQMVTSVAAASAQYFFRNPKAGPQKGADMKQGYRNKNGGWKGHTRLQDLLQFS